MEIPAKALNPFMPGSGKLPRDLVGRDADLESMEQLLVRTELGFVDRGVIYSGLRGMGKTVLLLQFAKQARAHGMMVVQCEANGEAQKEYDAIFHELMMATQRMRDHALREALKNAFSYVKDLSFDFGIVKATVETEPQDSRVQTDAYRLELLVEELSRQLKERNSGLFMFIDELQEMSDEVLGTLIGIQHRMGQQDLPFFMVGAGLPNLPGVLTRLRSYAERLFTYHQLGPLSKEASALGFSSPAQEAGRSFDDAALAELVERSMGYPYFIQAYGSATWDATDSSPMTIDAVERGVPEAWRTLDQGLYISRWQRASELGRDYMAAMAAAGTEAVDTADVARRLGRAGSSLTNVRNQLIELGLIYAPRRGQVAFTVPGMDAYIKRALPVRIEPYATGGR
ncbi:MAG: AAA family ATPase [Bifidobacterium animalis]|nr:AAA family ATPase [Bifidobacterium animalis]MDY5040490.1 AAA family ATPase [Bifidobacterium animalis]